MRDVSSADFERLAKSYEEMSAHVIALTAVVGGMVSTTAIDYERLEECINFAAKRLPIADDEHSDHHSNQRCSGLAALARRQRPRLLQEGPT